MIVITEYGMGNVGAIENMIRRVGGTVKVAADPASADAATKLVVPGVGSFDNGVANLKKTGWWERILAFAGTGKPVLGICLGMQLLGASSEEGALAGLGLVPARTVRFRFPEGSKLKTPHMGWNDVRVKARSPLIEGLESDARFYFAHSYHVVCDDPADVILETEYGHPFPAALQRKNVFATQFHPEKSHRYGLQLLRNFVHGT